MEKIGIIGAGNMGEALIKALKAQGKKIKVAEKSAQRRNYIRKKYRVNPDKDDLKLIEDSDIIILAVKPRDIEPVLRNIKSGSGSRAKLIHRDTLTDTSRPSHSFLRKSLIISIAAGIKTGYIERICGRVPVVRVMPNIPLVVGRGMSVLTKGKYAKSEDLKTTQEIFKAVGEVAAVKEDLMDAVTAISGSGPAYISFVIKSLAEAGVAMGLKKDIALELATQTASGTAWLLKQAKQSPEDLIKKVASKGGTTEAALSVFKQEKLKGIIAKGVRAAARRSKQLNRGE